MRQLIARFGLPALVVALLVPAGLPRDAQPTSAAPRAAVTGTPTEPATPTNTQVAPPATPTATLPPRPEPTATATNTPRPERPPSDPEIADPAITKAASVSEARVGDEVTFTITVTNRGDATANDVVVTDSLADYLDLIEVTASRGDISASGGSITVAIGALSPGEEVTIRIRARVNERAQPPDGRNGATVTTSSPGDDPSNNTSEVTFTIVAQPTATLAPTELPTPTPEPPQELPRTGGAHGGSNTAAITAAIGLLAVALSLLIRRRARG